MNQNEDAARAAVPGAVPVCAIGASAGGVEALQALFAALPADLGLAYVVVVHLAPDHPSQLGEILAARTPMPVHQLDQVTTTLRPDQVYVIAPDRELAIADDQVSARPFAEPRGRRAPIDLFFRSVAAARGDGLAVVLSGAGTDGTLGARAITEAGGVVLVQEPREALYPTMPSSALATGVADFVGPVAELAARIAELVRGERTVPALRAAGAEDDLRRIVGILRLRTGHDFSNYKPATLLRRASRRMQVTRRRSLAEYADHLQETPAEAQALFADLLISVTMFFRDPAAFRLLGERAVPALFDGRDPDGELRAWVVGCATGEEAYSVAILLLEEMGRRGISVPVQVFATDLDERALAVAREGRYPKTIEADVPDNLLRRFFNADGEYYVVKKEVRDLVLFANHSALRDPPFLRLDLVTCRNLLIYLERGLQRQLAGLFHYALKPEGYLFLGSAETVDAPELFEVVDREARLYRAKPKAGALLPAMPQLPGERYPMPRAARPARAAPSAERPSTADHLEALERQAPPSVLVDERHQLLHLSPAAGRFLLPAPGPFSAELASLVRPELRVDLRTALHRAFERREATVTPPLAVAFNGAARRVVLHVAPTPVAPGGRPRALVFFLDGGAVAEPSAALGDDDAADAEPSAAVRRLRAELAAAQERLQASRDDHQETVQELRAANEELQSINEEYRSTSEELETSKEELQSMNEELQTVNAELRSKLEGVAAANSDLQNLIQATDIATLFLDTGLRIRMFTPRVAELFNVTSADIGRAITDFTHRLVDEDIEHQAANVLRTLAPVEQEAATTAGRWLMVRLRPYRTVDDRIEGVVVTFVDVTDRRATLQRLRDTEERFRALVQATTYAVYRLSPDWSEARELVGRDFVVAPTGPTGSWVDSFVEPADRARVRSEIDRARETARALEVEHGMRRPDGSRGWALTRAVPLFDDAGAVREWFCTMSDVTDRHESQEIVQRSWDLLAMATAASQLGWGTWDVASGVATWDARAREIMGLGEDEDITAEGWLARVRGPDRAVVEHELAAAVREGRRFEVAFRVGHGDGRSRSVEATGVVQRDASGRPVRGTALLRDVTDAAGEGAT